LWSGGGNVGTLSSTRGKQVSSIKPGEAPIKREELNSEGGILTDDTKMWEAPSVKKQLTWTSGAKIVEGRSALLNIS